jgi:hypothetical protein
MRFVHRFLFRTAMGSTGQSSNPHAIGMAETLPYGGSRGYWIARSSRAMTVNFCARSICRLDSGFGLRPPRNDGEWRRRSGASAAVLLRAKIL